MTKEQEKRVKLIRSALVRHYALNQGNRRPPFRLTRSDVDALNACPEFAWHPHFRTGDQLYGVELEVHR